MVINITPSTSAMGAEENAQFVPIMEEKQDGECKIHIGNIPKGLQTQGLRNFFIKFGKVVEIYHPLNGKWAFVTYSNKAECEVAIMRIQGIFGMKADFAQKKEQREVEEVIEKIGFIPPDEEEKLTEEEEAATKTTPFQLPTFEYTFPSLPVTEDDYKNPGMQNFDPKREFLISHDIFWTERLCKEQEQKKKTKNQPDNITERPVIHEKIFSLISEAEAFPEILCICCQKKRAFYQCPRCKTPYCSTKCNNLFVKNHKRFCRKEIPKEPNEQPEIPKPRVEFPKNKSFVAVTAIYNPRELFVRSLESKDNFGYFRMLNEVHGYATGGAKFLTEAPQPFTMVVARRKNIFTRAFVVSTAEDLSTVILIDFGDMEKMPWREMKGISKDLASLPRYVFRCNLKDTKPLKYNFKLTNYIKDLVMDDMMIIYEAFGGEQVPEITLKFDNNWTTILNGAFTELLQRTIHKVTDETQSLSDVEDTRIWPNKNVEIVILDNSALDKGVIACAIYTQYIEFLHQWEIMQQHCENLGDKYVPLRDKMCLVRLEEDGKWHRAMCYDGNHYRILNILLVDSGQMGNVSTNNSRKLLEDFDFPCPMKICKLKGLPDKLNEEQVEKLKTLLPQNKRLIAKEFIDKEEEACILLSLDEIEASEWN